MLAETAYNVAQALDDSQKARLLAMLQRDVDAAVIQLNPKKQDPYTTVAQYKEWIDAHYKQSPARSHANKKPMAGGHGL